MKSYSVKINDFKNLKNKTMIDSDNDLKNQVEELESCFNLKINKVLCKGKNIVLAIGQDSNQAPAYLITGRNCYQKSIIDILNSVKIESGIIIDNRKNSTVELTINDLKAMILK